MAVVVVVLRTSALRRVACLTSGLEIGLVLADRDFLTGAEAAATLGDDWTDFGEAKNFFGPSFSFVTP